jgi:ketosteroid isomerase-like protein
MTNIETIESFYRSFQQRDYEGMAACFHESIWFSDPVFPDLRGDEVRAMWHMLCEQGTDLRVTFADVAVEEDGGRANWDAHYTFHPTDRLVHNKVRAHFEFEKGRIIRHIDSFDLWRWTRMALGTTGVVTGWSGFTQAKVRATAAHSLRRFIAAHPEYSVPDSAEGEKQ